MDVRPPDAERYGAASHSTARPMDCGCCAVASSRNARILDLMRFARSPSRLAFFSGAVVVVGAALFFGCGSSERPAASSNVVPDAPSPVEGSVPDAGGDQDIGDAASDQAFSDDGRCLDDKPAPTIDGGFDGGDEAGLPVCPTSGACAAHCEEMVAHFKLGVAQVAVTCLRKLADCTALLDVQLCAQSGLMAACRDPTATGACTSLVTSCDPSAGGGFGGLIDQSGCEGLMRGLNAAGRGKLTACIRGKIEAGTCANEVLECTDDIQQ